MEGRMFKASILMDNEKINKEGKYPIKDIYYTIEKTYKENGFERDYDLEDGSMVFYGTKGWDDGVGMMNACVLLQFSEWFMRYVKQWTHHENEQCEYQDDFCEIDVLQSIKRADKLAKSF